MLREVPAGGGAASRAVCVPHEIPREAPRAAAGAALGPRIKAKGLCPPVPGAPAAACVSPAEGVRGSGPGLSHRAAGGGGELRGGACWSISARTARGGAWLVAQVPRQPGREPREMPAPTPPAPEGTGPQGLHLPGSRRLLIPPPAGTRAGGRVPFTRRPTCPAGPGQAPRESPKDPLPFPLPETDAGSSPAPAPWPGRPGREP